MELKKIKVENYKSIESIELNLEKINQSHTYILFGKNGTGKSNFLRAINLLNEEVPCNYVKEKHKNINKLIKIEGEFLLNIKEISVFEQKIKEIVPRDIFDSIKIKGFLIRRKAGNSEKDCACFPYLMFDIENEEELSQKYIISDVKDKKIKILEAKNYKDISDNERLNCTDLEKFIYESLTDTYKKLCPKIRFWEAKKEYLIPKGGDLRGFLENPNSSIPLKNAFLFSGYNLEELKEQIEEIKENDHFRGGIHRKISKDITDHLNGIWKDSKIKFELTIEKGLNWYVSISDEGDNDTIFGMEDRSDGFQQLVSILLVLSIEKKLNKLENNIILIDEPETHLYPQSIEYLKDELLEIGSKNSVFISSHSIFILDHKAYHRHFKVSKEKLMTSMVQVGKNNLHELELLYNCLGTSLHKLVSPHILILEGVSDVVIFDSFVEKFRTEFGITNVKSLPSFGEGDFEKYLTFSNEKIIDAFALLDFDNGGTGKKIFLQSKFENKKEKIFDIKDILGDDDLCRDKIVLEDLLPKKMVEETFKEVYRKDITLLDNNKSYSTQMTELLQRERQDLDRQEKKRQPQLKKALSEKIEKEVREKTNQEVKEKFSKYLSFFDKLSEKIDARAGT